MIYDNKTQLNMYPTRKWLMLPVLYTKHSNLRNGITYVGRYVPLRMTIWWLKYTGDVILVVINRRTYELCWV